jgi:hypothetical protein
MTIEQLLVPFFSFEWQRMVSKWNLPPAEFFLEEVEIIALG